MNATANGTYQFNEKYPALTYPSLGSAIIANYAMGNSTDLRNPTEYKFGAYILWNQEYGAQTTTYTQGKSGGRYYTFQLVSSLFGGCAEKYLPMSAINGVRKSSSDIFLLQL